MSRGPEWGETPSTCVSVYFPETGLTVNMYWRCPGLIPGGWGWSKGHGLIVPECNFLCNLMQAPM